MNTSQLRCFVAVAETLHFPKAADALNVPLASLYSTITKLETEVGHPLFTRGNGTKLTKAGELLLPDALQMIADEGPQPQKQKVSSGGKAKASKGKGRAPIVKGQPKPYKRRQGR